MNTKSFFVKAVCALPVVANMALAAQTAKPLPVSVEAVSSPVPVGVTAGDIIRVGYQANRIYYIKVVPGAPLIIDLPLGEVIKNVWTDKTWFLAEGIPGASYVLVKAQVAEGVIGQKTTIHVITRNDLRISAVIEAVDPRKYSFLPPSVFQFYLSGQDEEVAKKQMIQDLASQKAAEYQAMIDVKKDEAFKQWRANALANMRDTYKARGPLQVKRVVDDGVQTFVSVTGVPNIAMIKVINKERKEEVIDFEFSNGAYVINRVLQADEKFELDLGKDKTFITLD